MKSIEDNKNGEESMPEICDLIKCNSTLKYLGISFVFFKKLSNIIIFKENCTFKKIAMKWDRIDRIINSMKRNANLTKLSMGF